MATKKVRRTQAERTETTRRALLDAAIAMLNKHGYSGATLALIAEEAGVSRGSILHQFGTRVALMTEVVTQTFAEEAEQYRERIKDTPGQGKKLSDWPLVTWEVLSRPSATAVLEILQGSRSDQELADMLRPAQAELEVRGLQIATGRLVHNLEDAKGLALYRLVIAAVRGLSLQALTTKRRDLDQAAQMLHDLVVLFEDHTARETKAVEA